MQNPDRFTQGWRLVLGKLIATRLARQWLFFAALLILVLGIGIPFQSLVVQAQDGGTGSGQPAMVTYEMRATMEDNIICIGQRKTVGVTIERRVLLTGFRDVGTIRTRSVALATFFDSTILAEDPRSSVIFTNNMTQQDLYFRGVAPGNTTIVISATVSDARVMELDEDVALPIPYSTQLQASVSVRVVPCAINVNLTNHWTTTIQGASVRVSIIARGSLIRSSDGTYRPETGRSNSLLWSGTVNRYRGCLAANEKYTFGRVSIEGRIRDDDRLELTFTFEPLTEGGVIIPCNLTAQGSTRTCADNTDGVCQVSDPNPTFAPESLTRNFPLTGGSQSIQQRLNGNIAGSAAISVTPRNIR